MTQRADLSGLHCLSLYETLERGQLCAAFVQVLAGCCVRPEEVCGLPADLVVVKDQLAAAVCCLHASKYVVRGFSVAPLLPRVAGGEVYTLSAHAEERP